MARQYGFLINTDRCVQCHACETACKSWNGLEPGIRWRRVAEIWGGRFPQTANRSISYSCMHCAKPACAAACPESAVSKRREDGIVVVDATRCKGCRSCLAACPFHIPEFGRTGTMQKCNLCLERLEQGKRPVCVATCPGEALDFGSMEDLEAKPLKPSERLTADVGPSFLIAGKLPGSAFLELLRSGRFKEGPAP